MNDEHQGFSISSAQLAKYIDHTLLKPEAEAEALDRLCDEAMAHGFGAVCVNSANVARVSARLKGSGVAACSVVGFPLGAMHPAAKAFEGEQAVGDGARELDMVLNIGALKSGDYRAAEADIAAVRRAAGAGVILKVIIETCLLTEDEKVLACRMSVNAGADFVKTSTGFSGGGATVEDVALMRGIVGPDLGVKASGGIKDRATALAMVEAGANRIGTSSGVAIIGDGPAS